MLKADFDKALDRWVEGVDGMYLDLDGYPLPPHNPYQCHDVWLSLITSVLGLSVADGYAPGPEGWTDSVFTHFPYTKALGEKMTKHHGTAGVRRGDVLFWRKGDPMYFYSHVAVALGPIKDGHVLCMTQNPGETHVENLPVSELLGHLRPITNDKKETIVTTHSYSPKVENRQKFAAGGDYKIVGTSDPKSGGQRNATISKGQSAQLIYGQLNVVGPDGAVVELAMAIDTVDAAGQRIGKPHFIGAESGTVEGKVPLKIGLTVPVPALTSPKPGQSRRVRLYMKTTKAVETSFLRTTSVPL